MKLASLRGADHVCVVLAALSVLGVGTFVAPRSQAQVYSGSLTGVVSDPSAAAVPKAAVVLTDEDKGFTYKTASDNEGRYVLRNLAPGRYRLVVSAPGMRTYTSGGITLNVGQNAEADVHFELQGSTETVSVTGTAPLLQTQDASTGQLINQKFINDLPLTSRSVFNLAQLSPGSNSGAGRIVRIERRRNQLHLERRPEFHG
ncbi:MAG: Cna B-type protein [Bryobacterales bacterium]|nr:Cna B-type protein [Bryobacterales bacterium]